MLGVVLAVSIGQAEVVPLSNLVNGGTIQSGDKVFSNFTYLASGDMPASGDVNVETITDASGNFGIRLQAGFIDRSGGSSSDAVITFDVSVEPGSSEVISGAILAANPAVINGTGLASVTETFIPDVIDDKLVVFDFGDGDDKLLDSTIFASTFTKLRVQKDIILHATGDNAAVTMSFVDQTFPQVPEPASLAMALFGILGLFGLRRQHLA
jgi:hypothetical protein